MARTIVAATALALLLTAPAMAQTTSSEPAASTELGGAGLTPPVVLSEGYNSSPNDRLTSVIVGQKVYSAVTDDADDIGTISDLVVTTDRTITAAVIDVGGFLGVGAKSVAVDFALLQWVKASDGKPRFVLTTSAEALAAAPAFIWGDSEEVTGAAMTPAEEAAQMVPGDPNAVVADPNAATDQPEAVVTPAAPLDRSTLTSLDAAGLTAEQLPGTAVYGIDSQIGTISTVLSNADGSIDALIVDVGGFLGLGAKPIAVVFKNLSFSTDVNDNRYLFLNTTQAQLEAQAPYDASTYDTDRTNQRLVVTP